MTEVEVTPDVYDVFHPSPVSLKQLAAMAISLRIWRCEINKHRQSRTLDQLYISEDHISFKTALPGLPAVIYETIEELFGKFTRSLVTWLSLHWVRGVYYSFRNSEDHVLEVFDDFVCDYFGKIDYVRTAERMMLCDRFTLKDKFGIACNYFFEDDIRRIWPIVSIIMKLDSIDLHRYSSVYYWICCLTNKLHMIPTSANETIDERMLRFLFPHNAAFLVYFWNRIPIENQMRNANRLVDHDKESFIRFILPKLNDQQLDEFVNERGSQLMYELWWNHHEEKLVLGTWPYIKNIINETDFTNLVVKMLKTNDKLEDRHRLKQAFRRLEIWNSAPLASRRSVIRNISPDMLKNVGFADDDVDCDSFHKDVEFIMIILEHATFEDRNSFWHFCWTLFIAAIPVEGLEQMMKLCLENEDEINEFKQIVMANTDPVHYLCILYLREAKFDKFDKFVSLFCPELQTARSYKEPLLREAYLGKNDVFHTGIVCDPEVFNQVIDQVYQDVDLATEFKNQFMSSFLTQTWLCELVCKEKISVEELVKFIRTLVSTEEAVSEIKLRMIDHLKESYGNATSYQRFEDDKISESCFTSILSWCFESDEEIENFKLTWFPSATSAKKRKLE